MFSLVRWQLARAARRAVLGGLAGVFLLVGLGFLTVAAFLAMAAAKGAIWAATVLGIGYAGLGLTLLGFSAARPRVPMAPPVAPPAVAPSLSEAFLVGLQAGRGFRRGSGRDGAPPR